VGGRGGGPPGLCLGGHLDDDAAAVALDDLVFPDLAGALEGQGVLPALVAGDLGLGRGGLGGLGGLGGGGGGGGLGLGAGDLEVPAGGEGRAGRGAGAEGGAGGGRLGLRGPAGGGGRRGRGTGWGVPLSLRTNISSGRGARGRGRNRGRAGGRVPTQRPQFRIVTPPDPGRRAWGRVSRGAQGAGRRGGGAGPSAGRAGGGRGRRAPKKSGSIVACTRRTWRLSPCRLRARAAERVTTNPPHDWVGAPATGPGALAGCSPSRPRRSGERWPSGMCARELA